MTQALLFERVADPLTIQFDFFGVPAPKGSKSAVMINGEVRLIEGSSNTYRRKLKAWQDAVESVALRHTRHSLYEVIDEPVEVIVEFHMPTVDSDPYRERHVVKPDLDKLCRATLDSLTKAGVWRDDSLVFHLDASARYVGPGEEPGCVLTVVCRGEDEAIDQAQRKGVARR